MARKLGFFARISRGLELLVALQTSAVRVIEWHEIFRRAAADNQQVIVTPAQANELRALLKPLKEVAEEIV